MLIRPSAVSYDMFVSYLDFRLSTHGSAIVAATSVITPTDAWRAHTFEFAVSPRRKNCYKVGLLVKKREPSPSDTPSLTVSSINLVPNEVR
jgi:hypothetical protein